MTKEEFPGHESRELRKIYKKLKDGEWQPPLRKIYSLNDREPVYNRASEDLRRIDEFTDSAQNEMPADMKVVKLSETNSSSEEAVLVEEAVPTVEAEPVNDIVSTQMNHLPEWQDNRQFNGINFDFAAAQCAANRALVELPFLTGAVTVIANGVQRMISAMPGTQVSQIRRVEAQKNEKPNASVIARQYMNAVPIKIYNEAIYIWINSRYVLMTMLNFKRVLNSRFRHQAEAVGTAKLYDNIIDFLLCEERLVATDSDRKIVEDKIAFNDGYLDIPAMKIMPPDYGLFFMVYLNLNVKEIRNDVNTPVFDGFLDAITGGDISLQVRIMEMIGYCLSNDMNAKAFFLLQGVSNSGKSTLINLLSSFFADDLLAAVPLEEIGSQFATSELFGKALNINGELGAGSIKAQNARQLKVLTGNDLVSADVKYKSRVRFRNTAKMVFATNNPLYLEVNDEALLERIIVIPFAFSIPIDVRNRNLVELLKAERGSIFWKAMVAYRGLVARKYKFSGNFQLNAVCQQSSHSATVGVVEADLLKVFLEENLVAAAGSGVFLSDLRAAFTVWVNEKGMVGCKQFSEMEFGKAMRKHLSEAKFTKKRKTSSPNPSSYLVGYKIKEV